MSANNVISLKGVRELPKNAPRSVRSTTEAVILTQDAVRNWKAPPFQRPLRVNAKVQALAETLKTDGGILPGVLTLGVLDREKFLVDGQHRVEGFKISGLPEVYAEIRICHFDSMADMAEEFVTLNSKLVTMRPDDILRGLEESTPSIQAIRKHCDFVGYDMVRRGDSTPLLSMSATLRCWFGSSSEVPTNGGVSAAQAAKMLTTEDANQLIQFLNTAVGAWGRDHEYFRLWGTLNLCLSMWLWRRTVLSQYSQKSVRLTVHQFGKCMMALSSDGGYVDFLARRNLTDRDRSPCYNRMKTIFAKRMQDESDKKILLPAPAWTSHSGSK